MIRFSAILLCAAALGCSAGAQKPAVDAALKNDELRPEALEATLRVLDEHPEYVDELFAATLKHPKTLNRFLENTSIQLKDDEFARLVAQHLTRHPASLRMTLIAVLDTASGNEAALQAMAQAMAERPQMSAITLTQREDAVRTNLRAIMAEVMKNQKAREAFLAGMQENSPELAQLMLNNPKVLVAFLKAMGRAGLRNGSEELAALVKVLGPGDEAGQGAR